MKEVRDKIDYLTHLWDKKWKRVKIDENDIDWVAVVCGVVLGIFLIWLFNQAIKALGY